MAQEALSNPPPVEPGVDAALSPVGADFRQACEAAELKGASFVVPLHLLVVLVVAPAMGRLSRVDVGVLELGFPNFAVVRFGRWVSVELEPCPSDAL